MSRLSDDFGDFERENPEVLEYFVKFAMQLRGAGMKTLSASLVIERIRWEAITDTTTRLRGGFKISNNHTAYYARKFNHHYPDCGGAFRTRPVIADEKRRYSRMEQTDFMQHFEERFTEPVKFL